jgi:hypothetical protein
VKKSWFHAIHSEIRKRLLVERLGGFVKELFRTYLAGILALLMRSQLAVLGLCLGLRFRRLCHILLIARGSSVSFVADKHPARSPRDPT